MIPSSAPLLLREVQTNEQDLANRLIAGTQVWDSVPDYRRSGVKTELASRVEDGEITAEKYKEITGEEYEAKTEVPSEQS